MFSRCLLSGLGSSNEEENGSGSGQFRMENLDMVMCLTCDTEKRHGKLCYLMVAPVWHRLRYTDLDRSCIGTRDLRLCSLRLHLYFEKTPKKLETVNTCVVVLSKVLNQSTIVMLASDSSLHLPFPNYVEPPGELFGKCWENNVLVGGLW